MVRIRFYRGNPRQPSLNVAPERVSPSPLANNFVGTEQYSVCWALIGEALEVWPPKVLKSHVRELATLKTGRLEGR